MTLAELRKKHPRFIYHSYQARVVDDGLKITAEFTIEPDIDLQAEVVILGVTQKQWDRIPTDLQNSWAFHLGLAEIPSYWKLTASPEIVIKTGKLTPDQEAWWHKLMIRGMGEYFYTNQIDFTAEDFLTIKSEGQVHTVEETSLVLDKNYLVPVGGGKDSALALCIFDQIKAKQGAFLLNAIDSMKVVAGVSDTVEEIRAERKIDPKLLQMNQEGYLNGHVPFSAYLGFLARLSANLFGYQSVAISNERSSNEGNVNFLGHEINHQYSKTFELEQDLNQYLLENHLAPRQETPAYFSLLRPWYELQISQVFTSCQRFNKYAPVILSCNRGRHKNQWCGECAKCLFTYLSFYPFVDQELLISMFGQNLFDNLDLYDEAQALMGQKETKPFDCVGTHNESMVGFYLSYLQAKNNLAEVPPLLQKIWDEILASRADLEELANHMLADWNPQHQVPNELESALRGMLPMADNITQKTILIFGLGREGLSTYNFIRQREKKNQIVLLDQKRLEELTPEWQKIIAEDKHTSFAYSMEELSGIELEGALLFKTPGVPSDHFFIKKILAAGSRLASNTELFFELVNDHHRTKAEPEVKVIGVTGTKGKSTCSSMIQHVLHETDLESYFGGNIGKPPLELWEEFLAKKNHQDNVYFVLEMSSHQLAELRYSPNIAVIENIVAEHLDYYSTFEKYFEAKTQIARYQQADDLVVFNADSESASELSELSDGQKIGFSLKDEKWPGHLADDALWYEKTKVIAVEDVPLKGRHNLYNTLPSIVIGHHLGLDLKKVGAAIKTFKPLAHRLELVAEIDGVEYYNDSIATMPDASVAALKAFAGRPIVLLAGGYERNQDYSPLAKEIIEGNVKAIVLFPPSGQRLQRELDKVGCSNELRSKIGEFSEMKEAIYFVKKHVQSGDVVLLSPGAASFGMFEDYRDRGRQFAEAVKTIG